MVRGYPDLCSSAYLRHLFHFSTFPKSHAGHTHPDKVAHWQCLEETDTQSSQLPWILPTAKPTHMHYSSCLCKGTRLLFSIFNVPNCQSKTGSPVTDTFAFQRHLGFAFPRIQVQKQFSPLWKSCSGAQCSSLPPLSRLSIELGLNKITLPYSSSSFAKRRLRFYIYVFVFAFFVFVSVFFFVFCTLPPPSTRAGLGFVLCSVKCKQSNLCQQLPFPKTASNSRHLEKNIRNALFAIFTIRENSPLPLFEMFSSSKRFQRKYKCENIRSSYIWRWV